MKAIWDGVTIAESENTVVIEGNHYFPTESLNMEYISESTHTSFCPWKGTANYYHLQVADKKNENAVWFYSTPKEAASNIAGRVAFWKGVEVL